MKDLEINSAEDLTKTCVDIRLFGATAAVTDKTITYTGPVQFKIADHYIKCN